MIEKDNGCVENTQAEAIATAITGVERKEGCPTEASTAIGKFKDVDALLKAYDCLQAEFTRRSQRLKQLEKETENSGEKSASAEAVEKLRKNAERTKLKKTAFNGFVAELEQANVCDCAKRVNDAEPVEKVTKNKEQPTQGERENVVEASSTGAEEVCAAEDTAKESEGGKASALEETSVAARCEKQPPSSDELYRLANENEEVRLKIIGEYLQSVGKSGAPLARGGSGVLSAPPIKAKTLREAGEMALRWFQR